MDLIKEKVKRKKSNTTGKKGIKRGKKQLDDVPEDVNKVKKKGVNTRQNKEKMGQKNNKLMTEKVDQKNKKKDAENHRQQDIGIDKQKGSQKVRRAGNGFEGRKNKEFRSQEGKKRDNRNNKQQDNVEEPRKKVNQGNRNNKQQDNDAEPRKKGKPANRNNKKQDSDESSIQKLKAALNDAKRAGKNARRRSEAIYGLDRKPVGRNQATRK